jgi:hypothetical protein
LPPAHFTKGPALRGSCRSIEVVSATAGTERFGNMCTEQRRKKILDDELLDSEKA